MCRLPGADGTWMVVKGGMGKIASELSLLAEKNGVKIETGVGVEEILVTQGRAAGVRLSDGKELFAKTILCNADPFRLQEMLGEKNLPSTFNDKIKKWKRMGTTLKVNLALDRLPVFKCLPEQVGQHRCTVHLLPEGDNLIGNIKKGFQDVMQGKLAKNPTIEWYFHTPVDPSFTDEKGRINSAFFVQWAPYEIAGSSWEKEEAGYVKHLFDIAEEFAPGFTNCVADTFTLTPPKIESHIGIRYGHIHHVDNTFGFDQRMPYRTPVQGVYSCSAGCHPAGSVIGAAGHNAAMRVLADLEQ
jgi:phytoene dehydrogenase-like protein